MWVTAQSAGEGTGRGVRSHRSAGIRQESQTPKPSPDAILETLPFSLWQVGDLASSRLSVMGHCLPEVQPREVPPRSGS